MKGAILYSFIKKLMKGYNSFLAEGSRNLSRVSQMQSNLKGTRYLSICTGNFVSCFYKEQGLPTMFA